MKKLILSSLIAALAACGGGGSSSGSGSSAGGDDPGTNSPIKVGVSKDLIGVSYKTETQTGVIAADGTYNYQEGETLTLSVGDTIIGSVSATDTFSLVSLFTDLPQNAKSLRSALRAPFSQRVDSSTRFEKISIWGDLSYEFTGANYSDFHQQMNIARLLIAMDDNNNLVDGVNISTKAPAVEGLSLNLNTSLYDLVERIDAVNFQQQSGVSLIMDPGAAVAQVYNLAGISIHAARRTGLRSQVANEHGVGNEDYAYNADGQLISSDDYVNALTVERISYTYDPDSKLITSKTRLYLPIVDSVVADESEATTREEDTRTYNQFGMVAEHVYKRFRNGDPSILNNMYKQTFSYQQDRILPLVVRIQEDFTGTVDGVDFENSNSKRFDYNPNDLLQPIVWSRYSGTTIEDEKQTSKSEFTYDQTGYLIDLGGAQFSKEVVGDTMVVRRKNGNSTIEETFDASGKLISRNKLTDDKTVEEGTYEYDELGRLKSCEFKNADGTSYGTSISYDGSDAQQALSFNGNTPLTLTLAYGSEGQLINDGEGNNLVYSEVMDNGVSYIVHEQLMDYYDYDHLMVDRSVNALSIFNNTGVCRKQVH